MFGVLFHHVVKKNSKVKVIGQISGLQEEYVAKMVGATPIVRMRSFKNLSDRISKITSLEQGRDGRRGAERECKWMGHGKRSREVRVRLGTVIGPDMKETQNDVDEKRRLDPRL